MCFEFEELIFRAWVYIWRGLFSEFYGTSHMQKAGLSLNKIHNNEVNDHGRHSSIVKGKCALFLNNTVFP